MQLERKSLKKNQGFNGIRTGIAEVTGSNPVEALNFFSGFFFPIA